MTLAVTIALAVFAGLLIGSFLTVVAERVPRNESVSAPRSRCGQCNTMLTAADLVPVASWLVLRGRCRHCGAKIGIEPLVLELTTSAMFGLMAWKLQRPWAVAAFCVWVAGLVVLSWIDLRIKKLPRRIIYVTALLGVPLLCIAALIDDQPQRITHMVIGAGIALGFMGFVYVASRGGMGDGDVRLSPLLGAYLGWLGLALVPAGLFFGFLGGAVVGSVLMWAGKAGRRTALPFGPFLAGGAVLAVFVGQRFVDLVWRG